MYKGKIFSQSSSSFFQNIDKIIQEHAYICDYTMFEGTTIK